MNEARPNLRYAWYVVGVLMAVYMIGFVDRQILSLLVGPVKASLRVTDVQVGMLQGFAFVMLFALVGVPIGALADRYGKRQVLMLGLVIWCAFTAACGFAGGFWSLFLFRVGVGLGEATISPCCLSLIAQSFPAEKLALATSVFVSSGSIGVGLAFTVGGQLVDYVSRLPELRAFGSLADAWAPSYFIRGFGWTPEQFGLVFGLTLAIPSVTGTIFGGWWSSRMRRAGREDANFAIMRWGLAGVGIPAALAPVVASPVLAMVLYGMVAFLLSFPTGVSAAAVQDYTPAALRARVTALYYVAVSLGGVGLGPLVVAMLTDYVFRDEALIGRSLAASGALCGVLSFVLISAAAREFRRRIAAPGYALAT